MDWYRKTSWGKEDQQDFEERLARSRSQRTQYIKIQASYLEGTKKRKLALPAIQLVDQYLEEDPGGFFEVQAYLIRARALVTLKDFEGAVASYQKAVKLEAASSGGNRSCAYLDYALFVARNNLHDCFEDVHEALEQMEEMDLIFPVSQLKFFGSLAIFLDRSGDSVEAKRMASMALSAIEKPSPFSRHPEAGVVQGVDGKFLKRLCKIAA